MKKQGIIFSIIAVAATFLVRNNPFFWDTVQLASKHGHFFYDTNFSSLILPENIDSGHLPAFGMYIAACWKVFGKTLAVSHFAMLPFLLGIGFYLLKIGRFLANEKYAPWLLVLCFADPVLASQSILVSPDIMLLCFFLMGLNAIWAKQSKWVLVIAVVGLGMSSMRGMMVAVGLFVFSLFLVEEQLSAKVFFKKISPFIPGGLVAVAFLFYHWQQTGWVGYHPDSPWAVSYEKVGFQGFVKNIAVLGWRMLDFGRVFACLALLFFARRIFVKNRFKELPQFKQLLLLAVVVFLLTIPTQLLYKGLLAHRYFLPFFVSLHFLLFYFIFGKEAEQGSVKTSSKIIFAIVVAGLLSGNLWVYPKKISQGWDSTLAHVHWFGLQKEVGKFIHENSIAPKDVGTAFPNIGPREWYGLNGVGEGFVEKDLGTDCYILYSNIMNDFSDGEIDELEERWEVVFQKEKMGVCAIIYKNSNIGLCEN